MALILSGDTGVPASGMPTGSVIQTVNATSVSSVTISSNTYTDTGLSATITPISTTSKILVIVNQEAYMSRGASNTGWGAQLLRNGSAIFTPITDSNGPYDVWTVGNASLSEIATRHTITYLDSPASISALTYKTQARPYQAGNLYIQGTSFITLMEIKA